MLQQRSLVTLPLTSIMLSSPTQSLCIRSVTSHINFTTTFMASDGTKSNVPGEFTDKGPSAFTGRESYRFHRIDVEMWSHSTNLAPKKCGPALLGRLRAKTTNAASSLLIIKMCGHTGLECVLAQLDKISATDKSSQLEPDLSSILD